MVRIWQKFKPVADAMQYLRQKNCWLSCVQCKKLWANAKTEYVHMKLYQIDGAEATRFICDNCLQELKTKKREGIDFEICNPEITKP